MADARHPWCATHVEIRVLGGFEVSVGGRSVPRRAWQHRRAVELVELLALAPGHRLHREQVIDSLWPALGPGAGGANLRKAAHYARAALGARGAVVLQRGQASLWPGAQLAVDIDRFESDGNPQTVADPTWRPLGPTPNFPEYPSAHACNSTAVAEALDAFFRTDKVPFSLDSRVTGTTREYRSFHEVVRDVDWARVLVGFHFRNSDLQGSELGGKVGRYVADHFFRPVR
jgi:hypothetical protein